MACGPTTAAELGPDTTGAFAAGAAAPAIRVCWPSPRHPGQHLTTGEYYGGWSRALKAAAATHVGTHGIRHRSATDIANSGIPVKVGMALTAHKTVVMFMPYTHTEDKPVRQAAELVANRRKSVVSMHQEPK